MTFFNKKSALLKNESNRHPEFKINDQFKVIFNSNGLVPVIIQNERTREVLRLGYLDRWALEMSLDDKKVYLFRRSLQRVEMLGEKDGLEYWITSIKLDQHYRSLLFEVVTSRNKGIQKNFIHNIYQEKSKK